MSQGKQSKTKANNNYLKTIGFSFENPYNENSIEQKKTFLIICEGKNTEKEYFESFPVPSKRVIVDGGRNTKNKLVDYAIRQKAMSKYENYEIWCVFDYDIKPDEAQTQPNDFNTAIKKAEAAGMKVAWSNDSFELWFLLHYQALDTALTRHEIYQILKKKWELESFSKEAKRVEFSSQNYDRVGGTLSEMQKNAIKRAKKLHKNTKQYSNYSKMCPCTTVYLLVEELNRNIKK